MIVYDLQLACSKNKPASVRDIPQPLVSCSAFPTPFPLWSAGYTPLGRTEFRSTAFGTPAETVRLALPIMASPQSRDLDRKKSADMVQRPFPPEKSSYIAT